MGEEEQETEEGEEGADGLYIGPEHGEFDLCGGGGSKGGEGVVCDYDFKKSGEKNSSSTRNMQRVNITAFYCGAEVTLRSL